jgi:hypothetical protein
MLILDQRGLRPSDSHLACCLVGGLLWWLWQTGWPIGRGKLVGGLNVKKLLALAAVAGGVLLVLRRKSAAKAEADLWRQATAPTDDKK